MSPCILPLLPIMMGSTVQKYRYAPFFISIGLIVSFSGLSVLLSFFQLIGTDYFLRYLGSICLIFVGLFMSFESVQFYIIKRLAPLFSRDYLCVNLNLKWDGYRR